MGGAGRTLLASPVTDHVNGKFGCMSSIRFNDAHAQ